MDERLCNHINENDISMEHPNKRNDSTHNDVVESRSNARRPLNQRGQKAIGGVIHGPTLANLATVGHEDVDMPDSQHPNIQTPEISQQRGSFDTSFTGSLTESFRRRRSTATSQTPWTEKDLGSDEERDFQSGTQDLQHLSFDDTDQRQQNRKQRQSETPTKQEALALIEEELRIFNYKREHGSPPPQGERRRSGRPRVRRPTKGIADTFFAFSVPTLLVRVADDPRFADDAGVSMQQIVEEHNGAGGKHDERRQDAEIRHQIEVEIDASTKPRYIDYSTHRPNQTPMRRVTHLSRKILTPSPIPHRTTLVSFSESLTASQDNQPQQPSSIEFAELLQTHLSAFPVLFSTYSTLRFRPWDIIELRDRLPPIEFDAALRLKLDFFAEKMDWVQLRAVFGVQRDVVVALLRAVLIKLGKREMLVSMVSVVITTIRVERIIGEIHAQFERQRIKISKLPMLQGRVMGSQRGSGAGLVGAQGYPRATERSNATRHEELFHSPLPQPLDVQRELNLMLELRHMGLLSQCTIDSLDNGEWQFAKAERDKTYRMANEQSSREKVLDLDRLEQITCLLVWLFFLESVPERILEGEEKMDVGQLGRVFRNAGDGANESSGAVGLLAE